MKRSRFSCLVFVFTSALVATATASINDRLAEAANENVTIIINGADGGRGTMRSLVLKDDALPKIVTARR